ncbi:MAG: xylulokinase [Chloroflexi bacterium 44-23]|nr:MAG: xylulokinase [Chloroflexi bacterium 44-23]
MAKTYFLGIDISTTGAKALLIDHCGQVIKSATKPLSLFTPHPLWSEQDPYEWWQAVSASIREVLEESRIPAAAIKAIGLTGQMHGLVKLDAEGQVLRPAILWNDQRTSLQCDQIRARIGRERLITLTGNDALTGFTAPKILWVQQHEPEIYARCRHILLPKDYIRYRLTGEYATDKAGAAGTLLFDLQKRDWSPEMLTALQIDPELMPPTFEGQQVTGEISPTAASYTGLAARTAVVAGGGDQAAGAVGVGAVVPAIVSLVLGTSGVVFATTEQPFIEKNGLLHSFCHALPQRWHFMGVMLSAAGSLQWYRDVFQPNVSFEDLLKPVEEIVAGADGLFFMPYLTGERTPYPDPYARAGFIGLTRRHTLPHLTRALLEGVAFGLKDCLLLMQAAGLKDIQQIRVSGGGARSGLWRQILADVLGAELVTVNSSEGAAFGAALLAGVAGGAWINAVEACQATIRVVDRTQPNAGNVNRYQQIYPVYNQLYPAIKNVFTEIATL